jgi:hypothetical protein
VGILASKDALSGNEQPAVKAVMAGAFGSLVLVSGSATVATAWIRQKLLSLCVLVQVSRSLSLEEMREFVRTLFFAGQLFLPWCLRGSHVECSSLSR